MTDESSTRLKVVDENGAAVPGAFVSVLRSTVAFPEIALVTDHNGSVRLTLPGGRFVIAADASGKHGEVELDNREGNLGPETVLTLRSSP